jgi:hypothetical protein
VEVLSKMIVHLSSRNNKQMDELKIEANGNNAAIEHTDPRPVNSIEDSEKI